MWSDDCCDVFGVKFFWCKKTHFGVTVVYVKDILCKTLWCRKTCKTSLVQGACCVKRFLVYQFFGMYISIVWNYCSVKSVWCKNFLVYKPFEIASEIASKRWPLPLSQILGKYALGSTTLPLNPGPYTLDYTLGSTPLPLGPGPYPLDSTPTTPL